MTRSAPGEWRSRRRKAIARDNYECQNCGVAVGYAGNRDEKTRRAEMHHKLPVEAGGTDDLENLLTLCRDCHTEKHPGLRLTTVLELFDENTSGVVTSDVAEKFDVSMTTARRKLNELYEQGTIEREETWRFVYYAKNNP